MDAILRLMEPDDTTLMTRVPFTDQQLKNTNEAATQTGYANDIQAYCQKAIATQVELNIQKKAGIPLPVLRRLSVKSTELNRM